MGAMTVTQMVADCALRLPIRLSTSFWTDRLNEGYRLICQQGAFPWAMKIAPVAIDTNGNFTMPADFSPGKEPFMYVGAIKIMYAPLDKAAMEYDLGTDGAAGFSSFSYYANLSNAPLSYSYTGIVFPAAARPTTGTASALLVYHSGIPDAVTASGTFPTPPEFDSVLMELAEAEAKRRYRYPDYQVAQERAKAQLQTMLQNYRSTRASQMGVAEQTLKVQDIKAAQAAS